MRGLLVVLRSALNLFKRKLILLNRSVLSFSLLSCSVLSLSTLSLPAAAAEQLSVDRVAELFSEKQRLIMLWSVDCPPCYQELAMLESVLATHPELSITLVSTDDDLSRYDEVEAQYKRLRGQRLEKWVFADGAAAQLRYAIDKGWSGVLPRSYFVDAKGEKKGHSGVLNSEQVLSLFP